MTTLGVACITVSTRAFKSEYKDANGNAVDLSGEAMVEFINQHSGVFRHISSM